MAKIEANEFKEGTTRLILTESQYKNVQWINTSEFIFDGNLYDLKEAQKSIDKTILVCKMDVKEKDFLEKLIEAFKQSKTKKNVAFSFTAKLTNPITVSHFFYIDCILNHTTNYSLLAIRVSKNTPPPKI
ncbi:MAG TPA: hypothetical protein VKG26_06730 [Bacteroidia bacterium]|nr:hypothetical protein [Bacteroidia bacterium]